VAQGGGGGAAALPERGRAKARRPRGAI
jgi:hypothetical protein